MTMTKTPTINGKMANVRVPADLADQYRAASKATGVQLQRLIESAMRFYPLEKFVKELTESRRV